ncbi:MAG: GNAT family N-acetyltransferase [Alphaproteobacteria bacterium]
MTPLALLAGSDNCRTSDVQDHGARTLALTNMATIETRVTSTQAEFDALGDDWSALFAAWGHDNYFLSPDWCRSWWEMLGEGGPPVTVSVWHCGRMVALMPLVVTRIGPLTSGEAMAGETGQYCDILVAGDTLTQSQIFEALHTGLQELKIDRLQFTNVRDDSNLAAFLRHHGSTSASPKVNCEVLSGSFEDFDAYMATRSTNLRKNLRRRLRKLAKLGTVGYEVITDPKEFEKVTQTIVSHKLEWLAARGLHGRFLAKPGVAQWFAEVCRQALASGHLHLSVLRINGAVAAAQLAFICGGRLTGYFASFDMGYAAYAVGRVQTLGFIEDLFDDGLVIDLMPPNDAYKLEWGEEGAIARAHTLAITRLGRLVCLAYNARSRAWLKQLYLSLPHALRAPTAARAQQIVGWLKKHITHRVASK